MNFQKETDLKGLSNIRLTNLIFLTFMFLISECNTQKAGEKNIISQSTRYDTIHSNSKPQRVIATPDTIYYRQPDGSELTIFLKGDEHTKRAFTIDGYLIIDNGKGFFEYAIENEKGVIVRTGKRAHNFMERSPEELDFNKQLAKKF
jgi:hypothetical protein